MKPDPTRIDLDRMVEINEALLLGSLRQHELTEQAGKLNEKLHQEIAEHKRTQAALLEAKNVISRHSVELENTVLERTAQLRETIAELEAFSYTISHDMRAPLRALRGFSQVLMDEHAAQLDPEGIKHLQRIDTAAARMDALIQEVLSYTRVLQQAAKRVPVDLDVLVRQIIATYPSLSPPTVRIEIEGVLPKIMGGEASAAQVVSNVLTNAVKFVAPGVQPSVKIRAEVRGNNVRLWFEDNGIGIALKDQERIFKMFEQVNAHGTYEGTGMGLAIVRKAVHRMGGEMGVESALGQGSKFWIQLRGVAP